MLNEKLQKIELQQMPKQQAHNSDKNAQTQWYYHPNKTGKIPPKPKIEKTPSLCLVFLRGK